MTLNSNPNFDEQWVIQIRKTLDENLEDVNNFRVSIFNVPKTLLSCKPDAYIPQEVAIGPYHWRRSELYEMQGYKHAAAKRTQEQLKSHKLQNLVDYLTKFEPRIRSCYHKCLDLNGETLAWMMAVDASFLLEFLQNYTKEGKALTRLSSRKSHSLVDYPRRKSLHKDHNAILRDIMMLENQIPLFLLKRVLRFQCSSLELADDELYWTLMGLCKELSPLKLIMEDFPSMKVMERAHLLDFLYQMIVPKSEEPSETDESSDDLTEDDADDPIEDAAEDQNNPIEDATGVQYIPMEDKDESVGDSGPVKQLFGEVWKLISKLNGGPIRSLKRALVSKPATVVGKLPWSKISSSIIKQPVQYFYFFQDKEDIKPENEIINKPPLIQEIIIPSVTELYKSGVRFLPTNGDITTISFDKKKVILHLPIITLDVNTETISRNLVAYEASIASGPLVFTRYTELMNGIIDTEEDAKLLRQRGIILNHLKSDEEVKNLWNGMSKSVKLTRVHSLDKVIEDVNKYYNSTWRVKVRKFMRTYVFGSWKFLTLLAAIMLLFLNSLQAFCSVYSCARVLHIKVLE